MDRSTGTVLDVPRGQRMGGGIESHRKERTQHSCKQRQKCTEEGTRLSRICKHRDSHLDLKTRRSRAEIHWFHKADWPSPGEDCQLVNSAVLILQGQHPVALVLAQMFETLWYPHQRRRVVGSTGIDGRATPCMANNDLTAAQLHKRLQMLW
jgi:hypothetical protein